LEAERCALLTAECIQKLSDRLILQPTILEDCVQRLCEPSVDRPWVYVCTDRFDAVRYSRHTVGEDANARCGEDFASHGRY
jgi:hypothetical protein